MGKNTITILSDNYEDGENGEVVEGVTIMIDGVIKQVMENLKARMGDKDISNSDLMGDIVMYGINTMIDITSAKKEDED